MPDKPDNWAWISEVIRSNWPLIYGALLGILIAIFRILYSGGKLRQILIEAPFLGLISLVVSHGLSLLGLSQEVVPFFGGMVGWIGVQGSRELAMRLLKRGLGDDIERK